MTRFKSHFPFLIILLLGLFFRTHKIVDRFEFAHDGDLYSWIVKDIVVDHHPRLIGQLTSAPGIFIGPFFYYTLIPFFLTFHMDPVGAVIPITILGMATIFSYWWVFSKLYSKTVGLIGSFLQAVLLSPVYFDRAVVPSTPTNLWTIWYFYTVVMLSRGNFSHLWILGILIGLIWNIHIALLPALIAVPVAILLAKKLPSIKQVLTLCVALFTTSLPLIVFEARHNFSQTKSLYQNFFVKHGAESGGVTKVHLVLIKLGHNLERLFFYPQGLHLNEQYIAAIFLALPLVLYLIKQLKGKELVVFYSWIFGVVLFFGLSSSILSEYYLTNIEVIFLALVSLLLAAIVQRARAPKLVVFALLLLILFKNANFLIHQDIFHKGYNERKNLSRFIYTDAQAKGFPCVAISYITTPGDNVGFRYFFWLDNLKLKHPKDNVPVYTIVYPPELVDTKPKVQYGAIRVLGPDNVPPKESLDKNCTGENTNLSDSLFGFTR